ncbi:MAG TPA: PhzF family phenazine biosynthesis protein [Anaeromyxobacter sp.]|nr:PhzF family phenazine biosynthesis protein [Anaeromyxobacter sp.]
MRIPLWQIDAFTDRVFSGNPAAVCLLERWLPDEALAAIAAENNLSETAFLVKEPGGFRIRWFTPAYEVELCGHATLASAHLVLTRLLPGAGEVVFQSLSGPLRVERREGGLLSMTFPRSPPRPCPAPEALLRALGRPPSECHVARDLLAVLSSEVEVRTLEPDLAAVKELPGHGLLVTARASTPGLDFVSRYFAPKAGIPEDPVTGSAHCVLVPFWAERLGKTRLEAAQVSRRGGRLSCEDRKDAVVISGRAADYLEGQIEI